MAFDLTNPVFHDADKAREYLESLHWPQGAECPHCNLINATKVAGKTARPGLYMCNSCRKQFTVTVGTIFEDSKIPLNKWLLAFRLLNGGKKGISANELGRHLGITYKSAWFMAHRIREAMNDEPDSPLGGEGKLVEREGHARSFHIATVRGDTLRAVLVANVDRASTLMSDDHLAYREVGREFAGGHFPVIHTAREYAFMNMHSNTAENFFSIFKRGVIGTYHHLSEAHIHRYCAEFDFRYNTRTISDAERTEEALKGARGKRLTYRQPASIAA
jgi:transposase-like protein